MALRGPWCFADDALSAIESYYYSSPCKRAARTLGLAPREARDWQNGNGTLIKQSESIYNYSNHGHIMEKTFTRTVYVKLPFDSFVASLWIFSSTQCSCLPPTVASTQQFIEGANQMILSHCYNNQFDSDPNWHVPHAHVSPTCTNTGFSDWSGVGTGSQSVTCTSDLWEGGLLLSQTGVSSGGGEDSPPTAVKYWQDRLDK